MSMIRPVSDLRNHFAEISRTVHETKEPVILTKNGYGDMVVMSYDQYQDAQYDRYLMRELRDAEIEYETSSDFEEADAAIEAIRASLKAVNPNV